MVICNIVYRMVMQLMFLDVLMIRSIYTIRLHKITYRLPKARLGIDYFSSFIFFVFGLAFDFGSSFAFGSDFVFVFGFGFGFGSGFGFVFVLFTCPSERALSGDFLFLLAQTKFC